MMLFNTGSSDIELVDNLQNNLIFIAKHLVYWFTFNLSLLLLSSLISLSLLLFDFHNRTYRSVILFTWWKICRMDERREKFGVWCSCCVGPREVFNKSHSSTGICHPKSGQ